MNQKRKHGFSLIEFLLVILIIGLLLSVILPRARLAGNTAKFSLVSQHGIEIASYLIAWADREMGKIPEGQPYSHPFLGGNSAFLESDDQDASIQTYQLVDRYTGHKNFDAVEKIFPPKGLPVNPFNNSSYFDPANDDPNAVPSSQPGLLYLASFPPTPKSQYRSFYLIVTGINGEWHQGMDHKTLEGMKKGIFVAQVPEGMPEYLRKEE